MAKYLELDLHSIECTKASEADGDELYIEVHMRSDKQIEHHERLPGTASHWDFKTGEKNVLDAPLFVGGYEENVQLDVRFMEMDVVDSIQKKVGFIGKMIDDYLGQLHIVVNAKDEVFFKLGKKTRYVDERVDEAFYYFELTGSNSHYIIGLQVTLQNKAIAPEDVSVQ